VGAGNGLELGRERDRASTGACVGGCKVRAAENRGLQGCDLRSRDAQLRLLGDEVHPSVDERGDGYRPDDGNAVLKVVDEVGVTAGKDDLRYRNGDGISPLSQVSGVQRNGCAI